MYIILTLFLGLISTGLLAAQTSINLQKDGIAAVKAWAKSRVVLAQQQYAQKFPTRAKSLDFWGTQTVYQIQVDRFNNGNALNDELNREAQQIAELSSGNLYGVLDYRHGGDLAGIIQRLDYLVDLGITSLWITPIFKHNGSYHGYCTTDFSEIDPGFGTKEELQQLVAMAHQRGIKVILDIVVNHMCDAKTTYRKIPDHYACANELDAKNWNGTAGGSSAQGELDFSENFMGALKSQYFFNRCGANSQSDMEGTGAAAVYGDFVASMFDFDTRNYDFQEIFTELHKYWIAVADIDGYRMDAVKHVSEDFIAYFSTHIRDYAKSLGKDNFFIVGEVAGPSDWIGRRVGKMYSNPANPDDHGNVPYALTKRLWDLRDLYQNNPAAPYPGLNAAYDFAHGGTAVDVLHNRRSGQALVQHFLGTYFSDIAHQNDYRLSWNLLEIHDWPRFASYAKSSMEKSKLGMAYLVLAEGSPVIYYGMEQGFNGDCHFNNIDAGLAADSIKQQCKGHSHALYRQDMFVGGMALLGSTVPEINALAYIGKSKQTATPSIDPFTNRQHELFQLSSKVLHLRQSCNALKYGSSKFRWVDFSAAGIMAISRIDQHGYEALSIFNTANTMRGIPDMAVNDYSRGKRWVNLFNTQDVAFTTGQGTLNFQGMALAANSVMLLVPEKNVGAFKPDLALNLCLR
jgi:glycosidase